MKLISSRHNALFKRIRDAMRDPDQEIALEGRKQVDDALQAGWKPLALVTRGEAREGAIAFTPELFDALADTRSPQDVIALFERPRFAASEILGAAKRPAVVLDGVQDPGNVGTIVRLAAAFDCAGVVLLRGCADAYSPKAIRASVGAVLDVPVANASASDVIACGRPIFAAAGEGKPANRMPADVVMVFGNEGSGVSDEIRRAATLVRIPTSKRMESLNVAAAAAILLAQSYAARGG